MSNEQGHIQSEVELSEPGRVGRWQACLMRLLDGAVPNPDALREAERLAIWFLSVGHMATVREGLDEVPPERQSILLHVAHADAGVRTQLATMYDLELLLDEARHHFARGGPDYRPWTSAITAEHLSLRSDPLAFEVARDALDGLSTSVLPSSLELVSRGRLQRVAAHSCLHDGDGDGPSRAWRGFWSALADLSRAGWPAEWAFTRVWFATTFSIITYDRVGECLVLAEEGATQLRNLGATYAPLGQLGLALVAILAGDPPTTHSALAAADAYAPLFPFPLGGYSRGIRAVVDLLANGPTPGVLDRLSMLRVGSGPVGPGVAGSLSLTIGNILCDFGAVDHAARWLELSATQQAVSPAGDLHRALLAGRMQLLSEGQPDGADDVLRVADDYDNCGYATFANMARLRLARDLERIGAYAKAAEVRDAASQRLPAWERRLFWEAVLAVPLRSTTALTGHVPVEVSARRIDLLRPDARVRIAGEIRTLPTALARLLCVLACASGPMTIDYVAERLWPDIDLPTARSRLNVALYRLRKTLEDPDVVGRDQDSVSFDPDRHWQSDVAEFRALVADREDHGAAIRLYSADLCSTQLAYDEAVLPERDVLRAQMTDLLVDLLEEGSADLDAVLRNVRDVRIEDTRVTKLLADRLRGEGRHAEATQIESSEPV